MWFGKCIGTLGGRLYEVWEVYGDPMGIVYMRFEKCMGTLLGVTMPFGIQHLPFLPLDGAYL